MNKHIRKFQQSISHKCDYCGSEEHESANCPNKPKEQPTTGKSGKWTEGNTDTLINGISNIFSSWLTPASSVTNVYGDPNNQRDNTMLYVGIGGAVLVVVLVLVVALKK